MGLKDIFAAHDATGKREDKTIVVEGMHCTSCERLVSEALCGIGATNVSADHVTGKVSYAGDLDAKDIAAAIEGAGFKVA